MNFTLYTADCTGDRRNCLYPHKTPIRSAEDLAAAAASDHVAAAFAGKYRSVQNFLSSDVVVMDVDNEGTDDPSVWVSPEDLSPEFSDISYAIVPSRNHMKEKAGRSARPRFHVYFPIRPCTDATAYAAVKREIRKQYAFFDPNCLDAGRFLFGAPATAEQILFHSGPSTIDEVIATMTASASDSIQEGRRNATLSRIAGRLVKRYGVTEDSYRLFLEQADRCSPPLSDAELSTIWGSARRFAAKVQAQPGYIPPEAYSPAAQETLRPEDYTDMGQAKVLCMDAAGELAYTAASGFLCFNGRYWEESDVKADGLVMRFLDRQLEDAAANLAATREALLASGVSELAIRSGGKTLERQIGIAQLPLYKAFGSAQEYHKFVLQRRNMKYVKSALDAAKPMLEMAPTDFDSDENLLNTPEGTWNLRTGERHDHDPSDYLTRMTAFAPGGDGSAVWQAALNTFFRNDADLIRYVQQIVGLAAIGAVYQEAMIIAYGDGSNGKSTFWNTVSAALGNYSGLISADALTVGCRRNVRPELAEVMGKRLLIASELEEGTRLSTSVVKQLCSTDEISAEKKYRDPFRFRPTHTLVLYTNHLPKVGASDRGIWRRLIVIPFDAVITGKGDIKNYSKYLLEHAGPAIVQWIIDGAKAVIEANYVPAVPPCVRKAIEAYRGENDWLSHFLEECCDTGESFIEKSGELYAAYRAFCARTGEYTRSTTDFYKALDQRGFDRSRKKNGVFVYGLCLRNAEDDLPM
ncbi:MAG: primase C-terminal domain-containing protein [Oscillospiraceae bacterium]|nr:primase C-terminal domain-containing protein [Oscillospiraceae bacterium]